MISDYNAVASLQLNIILNIYFINLNSLIYYIFWYKNHRHFNFSEWNGVVFYEINIRFLKDIYLINLNSLI